MKTFLHRIGLLFTDAEERRNLASATLLLLIALWFLVPWWVVLLAGAASFTFIILRPSVHTLELMKAKDHSALGLPSSDANAD